MREPSGAGLRKSLYSQRMLPACRHLWHRQRPAPASVPRRGKAHSAPSPLGDGAAGRAWITVRASTFRALATAHLRCSSRASISPRERRSLSPQRGPARPPPATTAVPLPGLGPGTMRSRTGAHQPAADGDGRRGGRHGRVQRPAALVHDGLRAPRAAARIAARPSCPGSGSPNERRYRCRGGG